MLSWSGILADNDSFPGYLGCAALVLDKIPMKIQCHQPEYVSKPATGNTILPSGSGHPWNSRIRVFIALYGDVSEVLKRIRRMIKMIDKAT